MTWKLIFPSLALGAALSLVAQTSTPPSTTAHPTSHATTHTAVHHTGTYLSHCPVPPPVLSPKIPPVPMHTCPKIGYALTWVDTKIGTGELALPRKWYTVHYTGYLTDGTKFDSSYDHPDKQPIHFPYGAHRVIPGWDTGFEGMRIGGKRRLFVPYQLAYGEAGHPPVIPPKSELVFDVELLGQSDTPPPPPPGSHPMMPGARPGMGQPGQPGAMHSPTGAPASTTPPAGNPPAPTTPKPSTTTPPAGNPPTSTTPPTRQQ